MAEALGHGRYSFHLYWRAELAKHFSNIQPTYYATCTTFVVRLSAPQPYRLEIKAEHCLHTFGRFRQFVILLFSARSNQGPPHFSARRAMEYKKIVVHEPSVLTRGEDIRPQLGLVSMFNHSMSTKSALLGLFYQIHVWGECLQAGGDMVRLCLAQFSLAASCVRIGHVYAMLFLLCCLASDTSAM